MAIRFGTSGWRAIIGDEFTFANVRIVTQAICATLRRNAEKRRLVIVGYDTRFLGERFAEVCVKELAEQGFDSLLCQSPTPTPTISHAIRSRKAAGGINFTASHNPPEYSGMKFSTAEGAPALPEITKQVEQYASIIATGTFPANRTGHGKGKVEDYDPGSAYLADLNGKIDFAAIKRAGGTYAYDPLWGTGRGYLDKVLREHGIKVTTVHDWRDVLFGGRSPEPDDEHLDELRAAMKKKGCALGLATDGDGDRFGVVDQDGAFITPNQLIALLFDYLAESRGWTGGVARSVATSHLVDRVARARGREVYETPVGFKFIGELILDGKVILGGEESAGLSMQGHYPEKDGLLACLLAAEAVAVRGASLGEQLAELYGRVGRLEAKRIGVRLTPAVQKSLPERLKREPSTIGGRKIDSINRADGVKFLFADGSWLLMRPSGTEPLVRIYAEAESTAELEALLEQGKKHILE
jgi:phosphoglucomutase